MKNITFKKIAVLSATLMFVGTVAAQDTVRVREKTVVQETNVNGEKVRPPLRKGEFGIRYMPTYSSLDLRAYNGDIVSGSGSVSHGFGIMFADNFGKNVGIQFEVNYYQILQSFKDMNLNRDITISYLNIPIMLSLNTDKTRAVNLNVVAGPQFGINVGSNIKTTGAENTNTVQATVAVKQGDIGFAYGAGLEFALNPNHTFRLDLGYRGFYGLVDMNGTNNGNGTYNVIVKATRKTNGAYIGLTFLF